MVAFAVAACGGYLLLLAGLFGWQRALIFPAPKAELRFPGESLGFFREPSSGTVLLYRPGPAGAPTVVYFHGNAEELVSAQSLAEALNERGLGFLAIEYPGYGFAPGAPSEAGLYTAAEAGLSWLRGRSSAPVVLMGRSLGTGVAVEMARRGSGTRLVLVSPYTSIAEVAGRAFPFVPARWLVRDRFDSRSKAAAIHLPVLLVHGTADEVIPYDMGQTLARTFPDARLLSEPGAHHNDVLERGPQVLDAIATFAREAGATYSSAGSAANSSNIGGGSSSPPSRSE